MALGELPDSARWAGEGGAAAAGAVALEGAAVGAVGGRGKSFAVDTRRLRPEDPGAGGGKGCGAKKRSRERGEPVAPAGRYGCVGERAMDEPEAPEDGGFIRLVSAWNA